MDNYPYLSQLFILYQLENRIKKVIITVKYSENQVERHLLFIINDYYKALFFASYSISIIVITAI